MTELKLTVFTPTYNRSKTLMRLYDSLLKQTFREFIWLVIDDGSTDDTRLIVDGWIKEGKLSIEYHYKQNGGKHTAMKLAWELANTMYITSIDSDDEFLPDAFKLYMDEWAKIEISYNCDSFAEIRANTIRPDGSLNGNYIIGNNIDYLDSFWHEMVLKNKNNNELSVCWNLEKLTECVKIPEKFWLYDKVNFIGEGVFWARIGRKYKTRYLNNSVVKVHYDGGESLLRAQNKSQLLYNIIVSTKYFLDENFDYFFWNPKYFINPLIKFIITGVELSISPYSILKEINTIRFRMAYLFFWPLGCVAWLYFKYIKRRFWF